METEVIPYVPTKSITGFMAVMSQDGDTPYGWDKNDPADVAIARRTFNRFIQQGYNAFRAAAKDGPEKRGEQMDEFDPEAERIIFVPQLVGG
jgi:hypothetical protein